MAGFTSRIDYGGDRPASFTTEGRSIKMAGFAIMIDYSGYAHVIATHEGGV